MKVTIAFISCLAFGKKFWMNDFKASGVLSDAVPVIDYCELLIFLLTKEDIQHLCLL